MKNLWLFNHAIENIWSDPYADHSVSMLLARVGSQEGEVNSTCVSEYFFHLPSSDDWYQVYQIGNLNAKFVGIDLLYDQWYRLDQVMNAYSVNIKLYQVNGKVYPASMVYLRCLPNDNVVVAVHIHEQLFDLEHQSVWMDIYDGNYRYTNEYNPDTENMHVVSTLIQNEVQRQNIIRQYAEDKANYKSVRAYVDCQPVYSLSKENLKVWQFVDIIRDGIVEETFEFNVRDLKVFESELDKCNKYLVHPPKTNTELDYNNDIEVHIYNKHTGLGQYYYIHYLRDIRQITHNDYSLRASKFIEMAEDGVAPINDMVVSLSIRKSGFEQKLIYEHTQIHELYKLDDHAIVQAMVGINSTVPEWQASNLEKSLYNEFMGTPAQGLTNEMVTEIYGYNAATRYLSDFPIKPVKDDPVLNFKLPPLTGKQVTVYEYTEAGKLLGHYSIVNDNINQYRPTNPSCGIIEPLCGMVGDDAPIDWDARLMKVDPQVNYRFYTGRMKDNKFLAGEFVDITDDKDMYSVNADGTITWNFDTDHYRPIAVHDKWIYQYEVNESITDGLLEFTLLPDDLHDGIYNFYVPKVLTIFNERDGSILIPEIDYHVEWPKCIVYSKERLGTDIDLENLTFKVRMVGISDKYVAPKHGFVIDGMLSNDNTFDIRDSSVFVPVVNGSVYAREDIHFREDGTVAADRLQNGKPYCMYPTMIPLRDCKALSFDDYDLLAKDEEFNGRIEKYMSQFKPQYPTVEHNPIQERYMVYSPIIAKLINDLEKDILIPVEDDDTNFISTTQFDAIMKPYIYLLDYEPTRLAIDPEYVYCWPHPFQRVKSLTPLEYSIIERVNSRYLDDRVYINRAVNIYDPRGDN